MATSPPIIAALPATPDPTSPSATFDAAAYAWSVALPAFVTSTNSVGTNVYDNAVDAATQAGLATTNGQTQVTLATAQAVIATAKAVLTAADAVATAADRVQTGLDKTSADASAIAASKFNLGNKASPPSVDNQGAALLAGATYYDTTLSKWRVWSGSAWTEGISAVAGVASVNGLNGPVLVKTINSAAITGSGNVALQEVLVSGTNIKTVAGTSLLGSGNVPGVLSDVQTFTASGTWAKPANATWVLVEAWGGGGSGALNSTNTNNNGGGGGGGYVSRLLRASDITGTVTVTIGAGGAAQTSAISNGNDGGTSTFGSYVSARGGGGGCTTATYSGYTGGGAGGAGTITPAAVTNQRSIGAYADAAGGFGSAGGDSIFGGAGGGGADVGAPGKTPLRSRCDRLAGPTRHRAGPGRACAGKARDWVSGGIEGLTTIFNHPRRHSPILLTCEHTYRYSGLEWSIPD